MRKADPNESPAFANHVHFIFKGRRDKELRIRGGRIPIVAWTVATQPIQGAVTFDRNRSDLRPFLRTELCVGFTVDSEVTAYEQMKVATFMRSVCGHAHNIAIRPDPLLAENLFVDGEGPLFTD